MNIRIFLKQLMAFWRRARGPYPTVGTNTYIDPTVQFLGAKQVRIGNYCAVGEGGWFNINHRDSDEPQIIINDSSFIGRRNFFSSGSKIELGAYCLTGTDCHFLGANHSFQDPMKPYVISEVRTEEPIVIGTNCWLGSSVIVLPGVKIGHGCIIGAGSVVTRDIPPFSIAMGNPAKVARCYDFDSQTWIPISEWREEMRASQPNEESYCQAIRKKYPRVRVPNIACSSSLGNL